MTAIACHGREEAADLAGEASRWLLEHQNEDGFWGSAVFEYHDRLVNTLAAVIALRVTSGSTPDLRRLADLMCDFTAARNESHETAAFELVVSHLLGLARELGLDLPYRELHWVEQAGRTSSR